MKRRLFHLPSPVLGKKKHRQRLLWFGESFVLSWMLIVFLTAFLWLGAGPGDGVGLDEPAVRVTLSSGERAGEFGGEWVTLHFLGFRQVIPVQQLAHAVQAAERYRVLIPPGVRFAVELLGALWE